MKAEQVTLKKLQLENNNNREKYNNLDEWLAEKIS